MLKIDAAYGKISLGMEPLGTDYVVEAAGSASAGRRGSRAGITQVLEFGAFVELAPGVEGLVHVASCARPQGRRRARAGGGRRRIQVKVLDVDLTSGGSRWRG